MPADPRDQLIHRKEDLDASRWGSRSTTATPTTALFSHGSPGGGSAAVRAEQGLAALGPGTRAGISGQGGRARARQSSSQIGLQAERGVELGVAQERDHR